MLARSALLVPLLLSLAACSSARRFPLRDPVWRDTDLDAVNIACKADEKDAKKRVCAPDEYVSSFLWDAADNTAFRPISKMFEVDPEREAVNVNSMDEVPDSAWFTNRIGKAPMTAEDLERGPCGDKVLHPETATEHSWLIDQGKPNGANPGFRVKVEGVGKFMLKTDPSDQPERATGATTIAARLYHAAGWYSPCDSVIYIKPSILKLKPGLKVTDNSGVTRDFDEAALAKVFTNASKREDGALVRMVASRWLPGKTIGPFKYEGTRDDDPNDVIPHENRRDLRGARILAAWTNHFDSREQNPMDTWMADDEKSPDGSPGRIIHYYIDLGDCFGSVWDWDDISRRLGHSYYFDPSHVTEDLLTLGIIERPWDRAKMSPDAEIFGYFTSDDFVPSKWHGGYPNPAFDRMTELDGAWAARLVARFTPDLVEAAVRKGDYTDPRHHAFLMHHMLLRQQAILRRYLSRYSPITDLEVTGEDLCGVDLGRKTGVFDVKAFYYRAQQWGGAPLTSRSRPDVRQSAEGGVCVTLAHIADDSGLPDDSHKRYVIVDIANGQARWPVRAHLYDLGPKRGFKLVGIERPDSVMAPD